MVTNLTSVLCVNLSRGTVSQEKEGEGVSTTMDGIRPPCRDSIKAACRLNLTSVQVVPTYGRPSGKQWQCVNLRCKLYIIKCNRGCTGQQIGSPWLWQNLTHFVLEEHPWWRTASNALQCSLQNRSAFCLAISFDHHDDQASAAAWPAQRPRLLSLLLCLTWLIVKPDTEAGKAATV